ncbi:MAG: DUF3999 family protein [Chthoniobacteraceae bacterium]
MKKRHRRLCNHAVAAAILAVLLAGSAPLHALSPAEWRYRQALEVPAPGLVRVDLPSATLNAARSGLEDLRLIDATGAEVPFLIEQPMPRPAIRQRPKSFRASLAAKSTSIVIETGLQQPADGVTLETPARNFVKAVRVEGSHDAQEWQELAAGRQVFRLPDGAGKLDVEFTPGIWQFLRLTIDDQRAGPVPFTGAEVHPVKTGAPATPVEVTINARDESPGVTRFALDLGAANLRLAMIELETPDPLFTRSVTVAVPEIADDGIREKPVATGTVHRVALDGTTVEWLRVEIEQQVRSRELLILVRNQDSPPLRISGMRAERRPVRMVFLAREAGTFRILSGHSQCAAPRYDLAALAGRLTGAGAAEVSPAALVENSDYRAPDALAGMGETSAPLDVSQWKFCKTVLIAGPGAQQLELDLDVLSRTTPSFADLRLMRAQRQLPYLVESTSILRPLIPQVTAASDPKKPRLSRWSLKFPQPALPLTRFACASATPLFERELRLWEEVHDERGDKHPRELGRATWRRTPGDPVRECIFEIAQRPLTDTLLLETDNGDNAPLDLAAVRAWHPVTRLAFKAAPGAGEPLQLYYGNQKASRPRYDLALMAPQLFAAEKSIAALGAEEGGKKSAWLAAEPLSGGSRIAFWAVLALVVGTLLFILARMFPRADSPGPTA